ncbi:MAG: iron-sulfur cluster assembly scaffold protein [Desulfoferrobacter sp.]
MSNSMHDFMESIYRRIGKGYGENTVEPHLPSHNGQQLMKKMPGASCFAKVTGGCGETMEIYLKVDVERITDASFVTDGCHFSILCGYLATQLAKCRTIDEAAQIGGDTILTAFKEVPENESHCAYLAAETLQAAIHDWMLK